MGTARVFPYFTTGKKPGNTRAVPKLLSPSYSQVIQETGAFNWGQIILDYSNPYAQ